MINERLGFASRVARIGPFIFSSSVGANIKININLILEKFIIHRSNVKSKPILMTGVAGIVSTKYQGNISHINQRAIIPTLKRGKPIKLPKCSHKSNVGDDIKPPPVHRGVANGVTVLRPVFIISPSCPTRTLILRVRQLSQEKRRLRLGNAISKTQKTQDNYCRLNNFISFQLQPPDRFYGATTPAKSSAG